MESLESAERVAWRAWSSPAPLSLSPPKQSKAGLSPPPLLLRQAAAKQAAGRKKGNREEEEKEEKEEEAAGWCGTRLLWAAAAAVSRPAADYGSKCALLPALRITPAQ